MALDQLESALAVLGAIDPGGLPLHQARILVFLGQVPTSTYAELGERFHLSGASISRSLNTLEVKHHLVEVYREANDRKYRVRLSRKGKAVMASIAGLMSSTTKDSNDTAHREGQAQAQS